LWGDSNANPFSNRRRRNGEGGVGSAGWSAEAEVFDELVALNPDAVRITADGEEADAETLKLMRLGVPLILGGRLPVDHIGRRVGKPDVLASAAGGGYRALDIKWHRASACRTYCRALAAVAQDRPELRPSREIDVGLENR
jgi:hypothetical protein